MGAAARVGRSDPRLFEDNLFRHRIMIRHKRG